MRIVINLDYPAQTEDYVHRIGRTARNQQTVGTSYTFFTPENAKQAPSLVRVLQEAGQTVNQELMNIAEDQQHLHGSIDESRLPSSYVFFRIKKSTIE